MKRPGQIALVLTVGIVVISVMGCAEQNLSDNKKCRLIANENRQLKKQIETQKESLVEEIERQETLVAKCLQEKKALEERSWKNIQELRQENENLKSRMRRLEKSIPPSDEQLQQQVNDLGEHALKDFEEIIKLREENKQLEARIQQLESELRELKEPSVPKPLPSTTEPL